jgi:hypothetical protein
VKARFQAFARIDLTCPRCGVIVPASQGRRRKSSLIQLAGYRWHCPPCASAEGERFSAYLLDADNRVRFLRWAQSAPFANVSRLFDTWGDRLWYGGTNGSAPHARPFVETFESIWYERAMAHRVS